MKEPPLMKHESLAGLTMLQILIFPPAFSTLDHPTLPLLPQYYSPLQLSSLTSTSTTYFTACPPHLDCMLLESRLGLTWSSQTKFSLVATVKQFTQLNCFLYTHPFFCFLCHLFIVFLSTSDPTNLPSN